MKWPDLEFDVAYFMYILLTFIVIYLVKNNYFKNFIKILKEEIVKKKISIILSLILLIFIVSFMDRKVAIYFLENKYSVLDKLSDFGNVLGTGKYLISIILTIGMVFLLLEKIKLLKVFYISVSAFIMTSIINPLLKAIIYRQRPYETFTENLFFSYKRAYEEGRFFTNMYDSTYYSMPSGHTIAISSIFAVYGFYVNNKILKFIYFGIPLITAFGRVYTNKHWLSDTMVAYLLGIFIAGIIYKINENKLVEDKNV